MSKKQFYEIQQFRQIWIWLIILLIELVLLVPIISGIANIFILIIVLLFGYGFPWLFYTMKLVTEVDKMSIRITFAPFTEFIIPFDTIKNYEIRKYRPIREYGGWGIRFNRHGKAYTVKGTIVLQIELTNGEKILIGTENPDKLLMVLNKSI